MVLTIKMCLTASVICLVLIATTTLADVSELGKLPKTKFSCQGRAPGYYADIEAGCTIYHMCDESGRQYTNRCPNATLFQQRMLICDHWYMVKCESSEKDYKANLLIGQKDALFVREDENVHEFRTPRPDLFDRPYSTDYSGESFKRLFKQSFQPYQNEITIEQPKEFTKRKFASNEVFLESESAHSARPIHEQANNIIQEIHKTYKESTTSTVDPISSLIETQTETNIAENIVVTERRHDVVPPSRYYTPPFLEPVYNLEYNDTSESKVDRRQSSGTSKQADKHDFKAFDSILKAVQNATFDDYDFSKYFRNSSYTTKAPKKPTTIRNRTQKPLNQNTFRAPTNPSPFTTKRTTRRPTTTQTPRPRARPTVRLSIPTLPPTIPTPAALIDVAQSAQPFSRPLSVVSSNSIQKPSDQLLPPFEELTHHDEVTLGPPIYYEWKAKMPSLDILPPLLDEDALGAHSQTTRSISETNVPENSLEGALMNLMKTNYAALKEKFSIPTFDFPLESEVARTGYEKEEAVNSFQLRIPKDVSNEEWYGENSACPECHPAFLRSGSCEPCVRIKQ